MAELAAPRLVASTRAAVDSVAARCRAGDFDDDDPPARLHGDLWGGVCGNTNAGAGFMPTSGWPFPRRA
jgi:fructosamine-3-kinase